MECKRPTDGRKLGRRVLPAFRMQAVKAIREGQTPETVAASMGVNVRSVFRWLAAFNSGGQNALQENPAPGRPTTVTPDQMAWLAKAICEKSPLQLRFKFGLWTLSIIRALIERQFGKTLSVATVSRLVRSLGFTPQKPLYRAWQQDAELVSVWQASEYPRIREAARQIGAEIFFCDEAGMRSDHHAGTTWAPSGQTPIVKVTGRRYSINMISAVSGRGEFRFMVHEGGVTAVVFKEFLSRLVAGRDKPIFLILDGHPIHKASIVRKYVESLGGLLKLFFLPPYSPQLNPDEQVWAHVKGGVAKQLIQNIDDMKAMVLSALHRIQKLPSLVRSFFRHPDCQYASY